MQEGSQKIEKEGTQQLLRGILNLERSLQTRDLPGERSHSKEESQMNRVIPLRKRTRHRVMSGTASRGTMECLRRGKKKGRGERGTNERHFLGLNQRDQLQVRRLRALKKGPKNNKGRRKADSMRGSRRAKRASASEIKNRHHKHPLRVG